MQQKHGRILLYCTACIVYTYSGRISKLYEWRDWLIIQEYYIILSLSTITKTVALITCRRKELRVAVLGLRNQLTRPTKRPAVKLVLEAAIKELKVSYNYSISYSYTMVLGIYGSKPTKHEGGARGRGVVYVAINP